MKNNGYVFHAFLQGKKYEMIRAEEDRLISWQRIELALYIRQRHASSECEFTSDFWAGMSDIQKSEYVAFRAYLRRLYATRIFIFMQNIGAA